MPEDKAPKTVDIDTSGPGADVELPEEKVTENVEVVDETVTDSPKPDDTSEKSDVESDVQDSKQEASDEKQETKTEEKKEELEQYSEGVQKRIAKLTKKWREAERQKEAAIDFAKGGQVELSHLKNRLTRLEPNYVSAMEDKVTAGLEAAKAKLAAAREANDINAEVEAQKMIAQIGVEEARVIALKARAEETKTRMENVRTPSLDQTLGQTPIADPKAEAWAEKNPWFGADSAMTYTAFDLHKKLTEQEGFAPNTDEYYVEVDKRMRLDFPHKFDRTEPKESTKPTQTVASATRSVKPGRNTVRLTSSEVAIAKKLGVPLEEYAKQKQYTKEA